MTDRSTPLRVLAILIGILLMDRAKGREPEPISAWTSCLPSDGMQLNLRFPAFDRDGQLEISLWGAALRPSRLPHRVDVELAPIGQMPGSLGVGQARFCAPGRPGECVPVAATIILTSIGLTSGAMVQGRITSLGTPSRQFTPLVFSGQVEARAVCG